MSEITKRSRALRKSLTYAEKILWDEIHNKKLGSKFRRQYPIIYFEQRTRHCFIADFACLEKRLVIELDGRIHDFQKDYDEGRTYIINCLGFRVLRFSNDLVFKDIEYVLGEINSALSVPFPMQVGKG